MAISGNGLPLMAYQATEGGMPLLDDKMLVVTEFSYVAIEKYK